MCLNNVHYSLKKISVPNSFFNAKKSPILLYATQQNNSNQVDAPTRMILIRTKLVSTYFNLNNVDVAWHGHLAATWADPGSSCLAFNKIVSKSNS